MMLQFLCLLSLALSVSATGILLPLYVYPGANAAAWLPVIKAIAAYPSVQWSVIINPHSGPGTNTSSPYPNDDYIAGIKAIKKYSNVVTLGYVDTLWGRRAVTDVRGDIDKYAAWEKYSSANISMDGIFFDDVPSTYDFYNSKDTQASNETFFRNISSYAHTMLSSYTTPVVCNSGNPAVSSFFDFCDTLVEYESSYSSWNNQTIGRIISDGGFLKQSAVVMYHTSASVSISDLTVVINGLQSQGVEFVDFTNDCCYNAVNGTLLKMVASICNGGSVTAQALASGSATPGLQSFNLKFHSLSSLIITVMATIWI